MQGVLGFCKQISDKPAISRFLNYTKTDQYTLIEQTVMTSMYSKIACLQPLS